MRPFTRRIINYILREILEDVHDGNNIRKNENITEMKNKTIIASSLGRNAIDRMS